MLSIVESTEAELGMAMPKVDELAAQVFDGGNYRPGTYARLVRQHVFSAATVRDRDGVARFILVYSRSQLNWLYIEAVASLKRSSLRMIFAAVDDLARHFRCEVIQCVTKLSGMLRYSLAAGYRPAGIIIVKNASPG